MQRNTKLRQQNQLNHLFDLKTTPQHSKLVESIQNTQSKVKVPIDVSLEDIKIKTTPADYYTDPRLNYKLNDIFQLKLWREKENLVKNDKVA